MHLLCKFSPRGTLARVSRRRAYIARAWNVRTKAESPVIAVLPAPDSRVALAQALGALGAKTFVAAFRIRDLNHRELLGLLVLSLAYAPFPTALRGTTFAALVRR